MAKKNNKNFNNYAFRLAVIVVAVIAGLAVFLANYIVTENDYKDLQIYDVSATPIPTNIPMSTGGKPTATWDNQTNKPVVSSKPTIAPTGTKIPTKEPTKAPTKEPSTTQKVPVTLEPVATPKPSKMPDLSYSMKESTQKAVKNQMSIRARLEATYENMSYYFYVKECDTAVVFYKVKGSDAWKLADTPVYSKADKVYKGSICYLAEGKTYDVKIELFKDNKLIARETKQIATKSSNVKIATTVRLSDYIKSNEIYGMYLKNIKGTPDGYIRIIGDVNIVSEGGGERYILENGVSQADLRTQAIESLNYALLMHGCEYVILEGFNVQGGNEAAVTIYGDSNNVILRDFDISQFGPDVDYYGNYGVPYDLEGNAIVRIHGLKFINCSDILFENSIIHNPKADSSNWNEKYESKTHPKGNSAIYLMNIKGGIVIRNNELKGSKDAYFMDIIEGWKNESVEGGIYCDGDIYGNTFQYANDDAIELDGGQENIRVYNNDFINCLCGVSISPNYRGPSYIFRNTFVSMVDSEGKASQCIKTVWNNEIEDAGYTFIYHNTFCTSGSILALFREYSYASRVITANNIMYVYGTNYCINNYVNSTLHNYDYDLVYNSNSNKFIMKTEGMYESHGIFLNPKFVDGANKNFSLKDGSPAIDSGKLINNFSDNYKGSGPDMGRYEKK